MTTNRECDKNCDEFTSPEYEALLAMEAALKRHNGDPRIALWCASHDYDVVSGKAGGSMLGNCALDGKEYPVTYILRRCLVHAKRRGPSMVELFSTMLFRNVNTR